MGQVIGEEGRGLKRPVWEARQAQVVGRSGVQGRSAGSGGRKSEDGKNRKFLRVYGPCEIFLFWDVQGVEAEGRPGLGENLLLVPSPSACHLSHKAALSEAAAVTKALPKYTPRPSDHETTARPSPPMPGCAGVKWQRASSVRPVAACKQIRREYSRLRSACPHRPASRAARGWRVVRSVLTRGRRWRARGQRRGCAGVRWQVSAGRGASGCPAPSCLLPLALPALMPSACRSAASRPENGPLLARYWPAEISPFPEKPAKSAS